MTTHTYHNTDHDVTIELASRQSGKTTRLIAHALDRVIHHRTDTRVMIISQTHQESRAIRDKLNERIQETGASRSVRNQFFAHSCNSFGTNIVQSIRRFITYPNRYVYFDEFEAMDRIPYINNAYYTGTPVRRLQNSHTSQLMEIYAGTGAGDDMMNAHESYIGIRNGENDFTIERTNIEPRLRELNGELTFESADVLRSLHGVHDLDIITGWQTPTDEPGEKLNEVDEYLNRLGI